MPETLPSTPPHILLVDDDTRLRSLLTRFLGDEGLLVSEAADAGEARRLMTALTFDLIVLDQMMPGESGLDLLRWLRGHTDVPVLMLTAMGEPEDRIAGLEGGADDYMSKPFEPRELILRISSILRRAPTPQETSGVELMFGPCRYHTVRGELSRDGKPVRLTFAESALLKILAARPGHAVSRDDLAAATPDAENPRSIDVLVTRLRRKIEADPRQPRFLQAVRGTGYLLRTE